MDNNNPTPTTPNTPPVQPEVTEGATAPSNQAKSGKMVWMLGAAVVIILVVGAIYLYFNNQQKPSSDQPQTQGGVESSESVDALEKELNLVTAEEKDDLSSVDTDLQNL